MLSAKTLKGAGAVLRSMAEGFEVPNGYREAVARVKKMSVVNRKPHDKLGQEINKGIFTGPKLTRLKQRVMANVADRCGKEVAERYASLFCTTGLVPSPAGSMGALEQQGEAPLPVKQMLCFITALAKKVYGLDPTFHNFPVNAESSVTFPYYKRDEKGVVVKKAYIETYLEHGKKIRDELEAEDVEGLQSAEVHLPIFFTGTTGLRIQPRGMKSVKWEGNTVVDLTIKPNTVTNWKGVEKQANMDVPGEPLVKIGKGRGVAAQSSTSNLLLGICTAPVRESMYQKALWHSHDWIASWMVSWNAAVALGWAEKEMVGITTDFSRMDGHMSEPFMLALLEGIRRADWSKGFLNLKKWIEFSPMLCPCDEKDAPDDDSFARLLGSEANGHIRTFDAGHHSGSAGTDVDNGILGVSCMTVIQMYAGNVRCPGYTRDAQPGEHLIEVFATWIDTHWSTYFEGIPTPGDKACSVGNKGDDHITLHADQAALKRTEAALKACAPFLDISVEPAMNFLGNELHAGGTGYASDAKFYDNNLDPETSIQERPYWMVGMPARMEHYQSNPLVVEHLLPALEQATAEVYGETWTRLAAMVPPPSIPPQPINAAELNFVYDHSVLAYKYLHEGDIRPEFVEATGAYLFVEAEVVETIYNIFRK